MKVKIIATGRVEAFDDGYAVRLMEQGKALPAPAEKPVARREAEPVRAEKKAAVKPAAGK